MRFYCVCVCVGVWRGAFLIMIKKVMTDEGLPFSTKENKKKQDKITFVAILALFTRYVNAP